MRYIWALFLIVMLSPLKPAEAAPFVVKYGDREADLFPYYFAFPYNIREISLEKGKVYFTKDEPDGGSFLYVQPWNGDGAFDIDTGKAIRVSDIDIEQINFWGRRYNKVLDALIVGADEAKREDINLWLFSEGDAKAQKLTDVDYIYAFAQTPDHKTLAYTSRYGSSDDQEGCLELLTIAEDGVSAPTKLFCDSDNKLAAKLNWWGPLRIDDKSIIFTALAEGDRKKQQLYRYDRSSGDVTPIAASADGSWLGVIRSWEDEDRVLYARDKELFLYDIAGGSSTKLHAFENSFRIVALEVDGRRFLLAVTKDVWKTTFEVFLYENGGLVKTDGFVVDMDAGFEHSEGNIAILDKKSADTLIDFEKIEVDRAGRIQRKDFVAGLDQLNDELAQCQVSRVTYDYVDKHGGGETELSIDAYLYEPRAPIAPENRLYAVQAFYGGYNSFTRGFHALCQVGVTVLSPVVRGDSRFGAAFETLNDGKNADAPIRDVIAGARYLQSRYGLADSRRIGTMGFSHGGWAAVRALSYPGPEHFEFGFALAGAGLYDILQMADGAPEGQTNIRGWFDKEFGDLDREREYLSYLSATSHMDRIKAPIFLYHGRNDERVTSLHSISFAERLAEEDKDHVLLIIEDQGHAIYGVKNWHQIYDAMFAFLEQINADLK